MKLSILDQAPISDGQTAKEALQTAVSLAQLGEELGYHRFWIAEHHDLFGLACPNPDVMLGVIGAQTKRIRIGAGAVLLPYYKPFRVAETYNLLETLFPGRIDLGLGRAPGGSAEVSLALSDNYLQEVGKFPKDIDALINFFNQRDHSDGEITPTPIPAASPHVWVLGTSERSAILAGENGLDYAFGHFMTDFDGPEIVKTFHDTFKKHHDRKPHVIVAITVICAETTEEAENLALSNFLWKILQEKQEARRSVPSVEEARHYAFSEDEKRQIEKMKQNMIIGSPHDVKEEMKKLQKLYDPDEFMVVTITHEAEAKFNSYRLLAKEWRL